MASYYVLTPPGSTDAETETLFVRDGFSWLAFVFPLPWLLVRRLWLIAAAAVAMYLCAIVAADVWSLDGLPFAFSFVLGLWTALEGGQARARRLERKGWRMQAVIAADTLDDAEVVYFAGLEMESTPAPALPTPRQASAAPATAVQLGLIGPYGGR